AGVSSFGIGGTNAHVIVEEAPACEVREVSGTSQRTAHVLALSARSEAALEEQVARYARHLGEHPELGLGDVCHTAGEGRAHFEDRVALVAKTRDELMSDLQALARGEAPAKSARGRVPSGSWTEVAFLFTGQGSQYVGMGRGLYETEPVFREALERCAAILEPHLEAPLLSVLYPEPEQDSALDETAYTQPALFALEYALSELWRSWGITPDAV